MLIKLMKMIISQTLLFQPDQRKRWEKFIEARMKEEGGGYEVQFVLEKKIRKIKKYKNKEIK